ncbi:MAG TPA: hypothetical protein VKB50_16940 [Vicinamibacterales bacterium]|nr:hypothetical protein [Vicinamibacterales bacterium]
MRFNRWIAVFTTAGLVAGIEGGVGQESALPPLMRQISPTWQTLARSVGDDNLPEAAKHADRLTTLFGELVVIFEREKLPDAVKLAKDGQTAAQHTAAAARANDMARVREVGTGILNACRNCHPAHREQLPDGSYRLKR